MLIGYKGATLSGVEQRAGKGWGPAAGAALVLETINNPGSPLKLPMSVIV